MKKFILIIFLFLLTTSCNKYIVRNLYEKTYVSEEQALSDVYNQLSIYKVDSIPLDYWITNILTTDTIYIEQKTIFKAITKNSLYTFVSTKYVYPIKCICPERVYYTFLIRYAGKSKDLR